ncbi:hypothetical protein JG688_00014822, partial [Phytophthora aleatoria]
ADNTSSNSVDSASVTAGTCQDPIALSEGPASSPESDQGDDVDLASQSSHRKRIHSLATSCATFSVRFAACFSSTIFSWPDTLSLSEHPSTFAPDSILTRFFAEEVANLIAL